jgi:hypothetical protein
MEHRAGLSSTRTKLSTVEREIRKLVQADVCREKVWSLCFAL